MLPAGFVIVTPPFEIFVSPVVTLFNEISSFKLYVNVPPAWSTFKLFPACNFTVSPGFINSFATVPDVVPVPVLSATTFHPELFTAFWIAFATSPAVAYVFPPVVGVTTAAPVGDVVVVNPDCAIVTSTLFPVAVVDIPLLPVISNSNPPSLFKFCFPVTVPSAAFKLIVLFPNAFIASATVCAVTAWFPFPVGTVAFPPVDEFIGVEFVNVNVGVVTPPLLIVVFPAVTLPAVPKSMLSLISYITFPFASTEATVFLPFWKSNPSDNVVVWLLAPFALYVKFVFLAIDVVSTFKS